MRRALRWTGIVLGTLVLLLAAAAGWVQATYSVDHPATPLPDIAASDDPEVIARGEYLVHAVAHCSTCHAPPDQVTDRTLDFSSPLAGGYTWRIPLFGTFTAANITPASDGIGGMTDGEIARAVRSGVNREGQLSPMMRFSVGPMSDEDLVAVVSWLRAQAPEEGSRPGPKFGFAAKALSSNFTPRLDPAPEHVPPGAISLERGRYLATGPAFCAGCHTPMDLVSFTPTGPQFSGGVPEPDPTEAGFEIVAPNLTPDPRTGVMAAWSEDAFVARFRAGRLHAGSTMPWEAFRRMTEDDLRSIYRYLASLDPVERETGPSRRPRGG